MLSPFKTSAIPRGKCTMLSPFGSDDVVPDLKWKVSDTLNTKTPIIPMKIEKVNTQTTQLTLK